MSQRTRTSELHVAARRRKYEFLERASTDRTKITERGEASVRTVSRLEQDGLIRETEPFSNLYLITAKGEALLAELRKEFEV